MMVSHSGSGGRGHVLLVEDDPGIMTAMTLVLQLEGYQVTQASNGQEALGRLAEMRPDLITKTPENIVSILIKIEQILWSINPFP